MEDRELIRRIKRGQKELLNEIAEKYYDDIYYFCAYQSGSREDAYDLAQETFLRFIRYVDRYQYQNLKGYLLTIAMNVCRNYFSEPSRQWEISAEEQTKCQNEHIPMEGNVFTEQREREILLREALLAIPQKQREAVILHHFYGYKNREIAKMSGATSPAIKSRINQGLKKLKTLLREEDFYE